MKEDELCWCVWGHSGQISTIRSRHPNREAAEAALSGHLQTEQEIRQTCKKNGTVYQWTTYQVLQADHYSAQSQPKNDNKPGRARKH